jgi:formate hydrogenlyase subunit 3/multisubunit Na+/H+ antiporter MnhD subunit
MISALLPWRSPALPPALLGLAAVGAATSALALAGPLPPFGDLLRLPPAGRVLLLVSAAALALTTALAPQRIRRWELVATGLAALGAQALLLAVVDPLAVAILLVLVGSGFATRPGRRPYVARARGPAFGALLIGVGWALVHTPGADWLGRVGALAMALGLAAAAGLLPYLGDIDLEEPASSSYVAWTGFFGPALALSLPGRIMTGLPPADAAVFGATLVALGLANLALGTLGAWWTASDLNAWRYSFLVDWGLALVGMGLYLREGLAAAYLALLSVVLVRLPLYLWARPALLGSRPARLGALNVLLAVLLAGAAPFSGFPVRLFVLQAATRAAWPLAIPLVLAMLLAVTYALRLARTVVAQEGREAVGLWLTLGLSLLLGLAPGLLRAAGGL